MSSSPAPCPAGVRILTCSFNLKETFQTSVDELYRTFISQEVPTRTIRTSNHQDQDGLGPGLTDRENDPDQHKLELGRFKTWKDWDQD